MEGIVEYSYFGFREMGNELAQVLEWNGSFGIAQYTFQRITISRYCFLSAQGILPSINMVMLICWVSPLGYFMLVCL